MLSKFLFAVIVGGMVLPHPLGVEMLSSAPGSGKHQRPRVHEAIPMTKP